MRGSGSPTKRILLSLLAACSLTMQARLARGAPFELTWSAPDECPTRERIVAASRIALGEDDSTSAARAPVPVVGARAPNSSAPPELFVQGTVAAEDDAFVVHLQVTDASGRDLGERRVRFADRSCEAIEGPTALLLAMMIAVAHSRQPGHDARSAPESDLGAAPESEAPTKPMADAPTVLPLRPAPERAPMPMTLGASTIASLGFMPNVGLGAAVRWTASISSLVLGVEGSFETTWPTEVAGGTAMFRFFDLGALVGVRAVRSRSFELIPLLEARGGALVGSATGFPATYDTTRVVGIVAAGALGRVPMGSALHLEILPDLRVPLTRDEFAVREGRKLIHVHSTAPIEARLSVGVGWSF